MKTNNRKSLLDTVITRDENGLSINWDHLSEKELNDVKKELREDNDITDIQKNVVDYWTRIGREKYGVGLDNNE